MYSNGKNMNYIVLINRFWQLRRKMRIGNTEADLYYFLLQESNLRNWENPFSCPNMLICVSIGITEKTLIRARNGLAEKGLIEYRPGRRKAASPVYTLLEPSETEMTCKTERKREGMKRELERGITEGKSGNFLYKRNKTKRNNLSEKEFCSKNSGDSETGLLSGEGKIPQSDSPEESKEKSSAKKEKEFSVLPETPAFGERFVQQKDYIATLCNNKKYKEAVCRLFGLTEREADEWACRFAMKLVAEGCVRKRYSELYAHFENWLKMELSRKKQQGYVNGCKLPAVYQGAYVGQILKKFPE